MTPTGILFTSDIHVHPWTDCSNDGGSDRLACTLAVIEDQLAYCSLKHYAWVCGGDVKHRRGVWPQAALAGLLDVFRTYADVPKVILCGNGGHDGESIRLISPTGLAPFAEYADVLCYPGVLYRGDRVIFRHALTKEARLTVTTLGQPTITRVTDKHSGAMLAALAMPAVAMWPWQPATDAAPLVADLARELGATLLLGHATIDKSQAAVPGTPPLVGVSRADLCLDAGSPYTLAVLGDVHTRQSFPKRKSAPAIEVPGDPYQQNWGERYAEKGALLIQPRHTVTWRRTPRHLAPSYYTYDVTDAGSLAKLEGLSSSGVFERQFVQVTVPADKPAFLVRVEQLATDAHAWWWRTLPIAVARTNAPDTTPIVHAGLGPDELVDAWMKANPPDDDLPRTVVRKAGTHYLRAE